MRRVVVLALVALGCRASTRGDTPHTVLIGPGISVPKAPILVDLPQRQRYRFVAPAALVRGLNEDDEGSVIQPVVARLREEVGTVLQSHDWVEVVDSADYDITVFMVSRNATRIETTTAPVESRRRGLPRCESSRAHKERGSCSDLPEPTRTTTTQIPYTEHFFYHVLQRRSDGALKVWGAGPFSGGQPSTRAARDLMRMLVATGGA